MRDLPERPVIGLLLRMLHQHYSLDIQGALHDAGFDDVHPAAANVFTFLTPEGATVSELADRARVRKQTMAQTVGQLERSGYVQRRPNPDDGRSQLVFLTARGRKIPPVTHRAAAAVEQRWAELIGPDQLEALRTSLHDVLDQLSAA
jgi:DNA-binding MarR family transcriptional regulator